MNAISQTSTLTAASRQWASRPDDQRFISLTELQSHSHRVRDNSRSVVVSSRKIEAAPTEDNRGLLISGPNGHAYNPTHFSFGQLSSLIAAPAGYLRKLPAPIAADCLNYGLLSRDADEVGVLLQADEGHTVRAFTGPNYGRVWNSQIVDQLVDRFGDGISGDFRVPGEFGQAVEVTRANTTIYASDRDMFVFLADEQNRIQVPNRRGGQPGALARGFFVWNSEVGSAALGVATFLFDYVCKNRIVWGATEYKEIRLRHTAAAPDRFLEEVAPAIADYAASSEKNIVQAIENAREKRLDDVDAFLSKRFGKRAVEELKAIHLQEEDRPIETLWDATTAITAKARNIRWQDERVTLERIGGDILDLAQ